MKPFGPRPRRIRPGDEAILDLVCDGSTHVLETTRLLLRLSDAADVTEMRALIDDEVRTWMGWDGLAESDLDVYFPARGPRPLRSAGGFAILDKTSRALIGERTWAVVEGTPDLCATGSWLSAAARGQGYGAEELAAFTRFAHAHLGFRTVWAFTNVRNIRARRQYEHTGFKPIMAEHWVQLPNGTEVRSAGYEHTDLRARLTCRSSV